MLTIGKKKHFLIHFYHIVGDCTEGDVRLVAGRDSREGIVEVCVVGHWISICRDQWSNREAEVVCRQLNYATSSIAPIGT